jgi:hypothetical protein
MPVYTTVRAKNLSTGQPFTFEVSQEHLDLFERQKKSAKEGRSWFLNNEEEAISYFEFTLFPAFNQVVHIFLTNGLTDQLLTQILREFGIEDQTFIHKLLEDSDYISSIQPLFTGIAGEGVRASRTLGIVYEATRRFYTAKVNTLPLHPDLL